MNGLDSRTGSPVLVVDDQPIIEKSLRRMFVERELEVVFATTSARALELAREVRPQLAIVDIYLGARDSGLDLIAKLRRQAPDLTVGAMSGKMHHELAEACTRAGAAWSLEKPFDRAALLDAIDTHGGTKAPPPTAISVMPTPTIPTMLRRDLPLETMTNEYIKRVLDAHSGNKSAAARVLGMSRQSLQRMLKDRAKDKDN